MLAICAKIALIAVVSYESNAVLHGYEQYDNLPGKYCIQFNGYHSNLIT